jgi:hypothetical protein
MNIAKQPGKSIFSTLSAAVFILLLSVTQFATASDPVPYEGIASLCAVDPTNEGVVTKGNGLVINQFAIQLYRIETSSELVKGWEVLDFKIKTTKSGRAFTMGTALLTPDDYEDVGILKDNFNFVQEDPATISSAYKGTGDLEGVIVEYQLTPYVGDPAILAQMCAEAHPYCASGENLCVPTAGQFGWSMSGVIYQHGAE